MIRDLLTVYDKDNKVMAEGIGYRNANGVEIEIGQNCKLFFPYSSVGYLQIKVDEISDGDIDEY